MSLRRLDWQDRAACKGASVDLFFPDRINDSTIRSAEKFCRVCPVRNDCAEFGRDEQFGIWGGRLHVSTENRYGPRIRRGTVPADGTRRRLQALACAGYGPVQIAEVIGSAVFNCDHLALARIRRGTTLRIPIDLATAIASVYRRLDGVPSSHYQAARFIAQARHEGWPDRAAWAGRDIDDPKEKPRGNRR